jgi:transposase
MRKYDEEFKINAVKKIFDGQSVASLSRELGVAEGLLHKWKQAKIKTGSEADKELIAAKKKIRELEMENEILKKAAIIFGRGS